MLHVILCWQPVACRVLCSLLEKSQIVKKKTTQLTNKIDIQTY